jgi:hypothetical protein
MPFNDYNPVVSGLQAGYDIASRIRAAALQQQELERLKQQDLAQEEERKFQREQRVYERGRQQTADALTEFTNRMKMNDAGIHQATPGDMTEATAQRFSIDGDQLVPTGQVGTSIVDRMFKNPYGGQTMVLPSEEQQQSDANYQAKIAEGIAASKAGAEARAKFNATAGAVPPSVAERLGVAPGTPVSQATQEEIFKNLLNPPSENWTSQMTDQGLIQVNPKTGASRAVNTPGGKAYTRTPVSLMGGGVLNIPLTPLPANWQPGQLNEAALTKYPTSAQRLAKMLVNYDVAMPTGIAAGREPWASAIQAAGELDPTWKASEYQSRLAARRSFTSGPDSKIKASINMAIGHLGTLSKVVNELDNWPVEKVNQLGNWYNTKVKGNPRVGKFETAANGVSAELATAFKGAAGTDPEIKEWRKTMNPNAAKAIQNANIATAVEMLGSRLAVQRQKWEDAQGRPLDMPILSQKSREILKSIGVDVENLDPTPQRGAGRQVPAAGASGAPAAAPANTQPDEQIIVNPQTGERRVLRGGEWVPLP